MKKFLENNALYVQNDDKLVYKVESFEAYDGWNSLHLNLVLVAGWDYLRPDHSDVQGWCGANWFVEEVQTETVIQYFMEEGMKESLEANGYEVLGKFDELKDASLKALILKAKEES